MACAEDVLTEAVSLRVSSNETIEVNESSLSTSNDSNKPKTSQITHNFNQSALIIKSPNDNFDRTGRND